MPASEGLAAGLAAGQLNLCAIGRASCRTPRPAGRPEPGRAGTRGRRRPRPPSMTRRRRLTGGRPIALGPATSSVSALDRVGEVRPGGGAGERADSERMMRPSRPFWRRRRARSRPGPAPGFGRWSCGTSPRRMSSATLATSGGRCRPGRSSRCSSDRAGRPGWRPSWRPAARLHDGGVDHLPPMARQHRNEALKQRPDGARSGCPFFGVSMC